jgi:hypothetical protein
MPKHLAPRVANLRVSFYFISVLGQIIQGHKVRHLLLVTWGLLKRFFKNISALTPNKKPLGGGGGELI